MGATKAGFWLGMLLVYLPFIFLVLSWFFEWFWDMFEDFVALLQDMLEIGPF